VALAIAVPFPDHGLGHDLHGGKPHIPVGPKGYGKDQYFQYINVPAHKVFEWGYKRGIDPHHYREEYLSQKDHTFKAKVKWGDAHGGYGEHFYDYNHGPKHDKHVVDHAPVYKPH